MTPIPDFDHNNVIPPHLGDPTNPSHLSPYICSTIELCQRFATSKERIIILKGLIDFRMRMTQERVEVGFQWLDGSFVENIEASEQRAPQDLDVVTFFQVNEFNNNIQNSFPEFVSPSLSKSVYKLDHFPVDYAYQPEVTVEITRYWIQLFTHNRKKIWKGILRLPLNTPNEDQQALKYLNGLNL